MRVGSAAETGTGGGGCAVATLHEGIPGGTRHLRY